MGFLKKLFGRNKEEAVPAPPPAPSPPVSPEPEPEMLEINEMTVQELQEQMNASEDLVVVDLRQAWEYTHGHIPGAVSIPMMEFIGRYEEIPQDKKVIMQCYHGFTSLDASGFLIENGWKPEQIYSLSGGITDWVQTFGMEALERDEA